MPRGPTTLRTWLRHRHTQDELIAIAKYGAISGMRPPDLAIEITDRCYQRYEDEIWEVLGCAARCNACSPVELVLKMPAAVLVEDGASFRAMLFWSAVELVAVELVENPP